MKDQYRVTINSCTWNRNKSTMLAVTITSGVCSLSKCSMHTASNTRHPDTSYKQPFQWNSHSSVLQPEQYVSRVTPITFSLSTSTVTPRKCCFNTGRLYIANKIASHLKSKTIIDYLQPSPQLSIPRAIQQLALCCLKCKKSQST
jgi:hypothetical protein